MKKSLSKTLALVCAMALIFSLCPCFAASAATDLNALTAEQLAVNATKKVNQIPSGIVYDLTLPTDGLAWTSSNENVISTAGVVKRPLTEDATVTLTADDGAEKKEFTFTVKAKTTNVIAQDSFYYTGLVEGESFYTGMGNDWKISPAAPNSKLLTDSATGNKYLDADMSAASTQLFWNKSVDETGVLYLNFDAWHPATGSFGANKTESMTVSLQAYVDVTTAEGTTTERLIRLAVFYDGDFYLGNNGSGLNTELHATDLKPVSLELDLANKKLYGSYNGGTRMEMDMTRLTYGTSGANEATTLLSTDTITGLNYLRFLANSGGAENIKLDNISLSTDAELEGAEALSFLSADELAYNEETQIKQVPTAIEADLSVPEINNVTWTSSSPDVISVTEGELGKVSRPLYEDAAVTLTATPTDGTPVTFDFTVKAYAFDVVAQENFDYDGLENESKSANIYTSMTDWTDRYSHTDSQIKTDAKNNKYISMGMSGAYATKRWYKEAQGDVVYFDLDVMLDEHNGPINIMAYVDAKDANNSTQSRKVNLTTIYSERIYWGNNASTAGMQVFADGVLKHLSFKIDLKNKKVYGSYDNGVWTEVDMTASHGGGQVLATDSLVKVTRIEFYGWSSASPDFVVDNMVLGVDADVSNIVDQLGNVEKVKAVKSRITKTSLTGETAGGITQNLDLDGGYADLETDATVTWTSANPGITIAADGKTATVTQAALPQSGALTATITSGEGDGAATDTVILPFTVAPAGTKPIANVVDEDFEQYTAGQTLNWALNPTTSPNITAVKDANTDSMVGQAVRTDATKDTYHLWRLYNANGGTMEWTERYMLSCDLQYTPDADNSIVYVRQMGAQNFNYVGLDYTKKEVILGNKSYGYAVEKRFKMRDTAGLNFAEGEWVHIDIDFNAAKRETMTYINGVAVCEYPMEMDDIWIKSSYSMPMRGLDLTMSGPGRAKIDNISIRVFEEPAEVFDSAKDFTVQKFVLSNQTGESISTIGANTTQINATLRVTANRTPESGAAKLFLAVYDTEGKLYKLNSADVTKGDYGYDIVKTTVELEGDCTGYNAKAFLWYDGKLQPVTDNRALDDELALHDAEHVKELFNREATYQTAASLGYAGYESERDDNIQAIFFDGEDYLGNPTKHFAYFGVPEGAGKDNPVPGVVLVHGGGGTAYDDWVKFWNDRGYAAIAMDMNGCLPDASISRHAWAGAENDYFGSTKLVDTTQDLWMYHAVAEVVRAHNLLRADERIDNSKIGVTGISWGSNVTCTTLGVDTRFAFAIPVYGSGFLYEMGSYQSGNLNDEMLDWDPSNFIAKANKSMPTLWLNSDLDSHFAIDGFSKSAELMGENAQIRIQHEMPHSQSNGSDPNLVPEVYSFADWVVGKSNTPLLQVGEPVVNGSTVTVTLSGEATSATLYYTVAEKLEYDAVKGQTPQFTFEKVTTGTSTDNKTWTFTLPDGAKKFYVDFNYLHGGTTDHMVSTKLIHIQ